MFSNIFSTTAQQPQQQQPQQSSLFNPQAQGGIFGGTQPQPQQNQNLGGGSLFGGNQPKPASGGSSLFGNLLGSNQPPTNNSFMPQQQPAGNTLFGGIPNQNPPAPIGGGLFGSGFGTGSTFPMATNTGQAQNQGGGLFGNNQPQPQTGGLFGGGGLPNQQNTNGIFGGGPTTVGSSLGGGLFGTNTNQPNTGGSLFANNQTNNFGTGLGLATTPSFTGAAGGMMGNQGAGGTIGIPFDKSQTKKSNENCWVISINAMPAYKDKHLQELRIEDYKLIKEGRLPDEMKMLLQSGQSLANYQSKPGGGFNLGGTSQQSMGTQGFGLMNNNQQQQPQGSLFNTNNSLNNKPAAAGGGLFGNASQTNNSFFGGNPTGNTSNSSTPLFGAAQNNFNQPTNTPTTSLFPGFGSNTNTKPLFGQNQPTQQQGLGVFGQGMTGGLTQTNPQATTGTSIFGQAAQTGGLFGSAQPNQFGSNFMNKPADNTGQTGGGLFGNMSAPTTSFQSQPGSLFGQPQVQMPNQNTGLTSGFMQQQQPGLFQPNTNNNFAMGNNMMASNQYNMAGQMNLPANNMGSFNQYPTDQIYNPNLGMFTGSQCFTNTPTQNNWLYHDWNRDYQKFYGSSYEENDDFGNLTYLPYKKRGGSMRNPKLLNNFTISRKNDSINNDKSDLFERKKNLSLEKKINQDVERKQKDFTDKEPNIMGYQQEKMSLFQSNNSKNEEKSGVVGDRQKIQELMDPAIRLTIELKGPKQGSFSVECELDVSIGEMKSQILEILEKNFGKNFILQEKLFKIMVNHPEKGIIVLNDNHTLEYYKLKNNQTLTLIKDLNVEDEEEFEMKHQRHKYLNQLAPESMIPILTKQGYYLEPSLQQLSRMGEEELRKVQNFTIGNEFATVKFEGNTDVRRLNLDKIVNFSFRSVELYPEEIYNEENKPAIGKELNKPALIVFHKFKVEESEKLTKEKIVKKFKNWAKKCNMEFLNFDLEHGNLTVRVPNF